MRLEVQSLSISANGPNGPIPLVRDVSFAVGSGEFVGLVGESGCGKSLTLRAILGLLPNPPYEVTGRVLLDDRDMVTMSEPERRKLRGASLSLVPQDPMGSLDPVFTIGSQIDEVLRSHGLPTVVEGRRRATTLLSNVDVPDPEKRLTQYPHEFSGGMRQRVIVAMALAASPSLLIADEPTTALDATTQAIVLEIIRDALRERDMGLILVTHDLAIVSEMVERVNVMYAGQIVETASTDDLFDDPQHPYSRGLISSIPTMSEDPDDLSPIDGSPPHLSNLPHGCTFATRCWISKSDCTSQEIPLAAPDGAQLRSTRCLATQPNGWNTGSRIPAPTQ